MKKLITITLSLIILIPLFTETSAAEGSGLKCETTDECFEGEVCHRGECIDIEDVLLKRPGEDPLHSIFDPELGPELGAVGDLPDVEIPNVIATVIKTILGWSMILTLVAIVVSAFFYLISQGNEENTSKAKNIIIYLVIGIAIMAAAYGIVSGVTQFDFFQAVQ